MKSILLLCDRYFDDTSANGVCTRNLAHEFYNRGFSVHVVACTDRSILTPIITSNIYVYGIPSSWQSRIINKYLYRKNRFCDVLVQFVRLISGFFALFTYPVEPLNARISKVTKLALGIIKQNDIKIVVATSRPYDSIVVGENLKNKIKSGITLITYHYDVLFYPNETNRLLYAYKRWKFLTEFKKELSFSDKILLPESCKERFDSSKIVYTGFPVYFKKPIIVNSGIRYSSEFINITYVGSLDDYNRNPVLFFEYLRNQQVYCAKQLLLHIWGNIKSRHLLEYIEVSDMIYYHGSVDSKYVADIYAQSDALFNISNKITHNYIPSKIFQMFSSGKPIINFVQHPKDVSLRYFECYRRCYNVTIGMIENNEQFPIETVLNNTQSPLIENNLFDNFIPSNICDSILK